MGEQGDDALCDAAVVISAPVDLTTSAKAMHRFVAKRIYTPYSQVIVGPGVCQN